jgi:hypothetical protein
VESNEPRLIAFNLYLDDEGSSVTGVQVHPDAQSMVSHMQVVRDYITTAYGDFLESRPGPGMRRRRHGSRGDQADDPSGGRDHRDAATYRRVHAILGVRIGVTKPRRDVVQPAVEVRVDRGSAGEPWR